MTCPRCSRHPCLCGKAYYQLSQEELHDLIAKLIRVLVAKAKIGICKTVLDKKTQKGEEHEQA